MRGSVRPLSVSGSDAATNPPWSQQWLIVIGLVADARYRELEHARLGVFGCAAR